MGHRQRINGGGKSVGAVCRGIVLLIVLSTLASTPPWAQRLRVRTYSEGEGLPSSAVQDVTQDQDGLMWFATRSGIASYDGTEWRAYGQNEGLESLNQLALHPGINAGMWSVAARVPLRVYRFEDGLWRALPSPPLSGTAEPNCLEVFESDGRPLVAVGTTNGLYLWDGDWRHLGTADGLPDSDIRALEAVDGRLFVGTTTGLATLTGGAVQDLTDRLKDVAAPGTLGLAASPIDGSVWLAGESWLGRLDADGRFVLEGRLEEPLAINYFSRGVALSADIHGGVYYGNPTILRYYHPLEGFTLVDQKSGMATGDATNVFIDREGNAWVAGLRGVNKIVSRRFLTLREEHGLLEDEVSAVIERRDGTFLIGHPNGVSILNGDSIAHVKLEFDRQDRAAWVRVLDFEEDHDAQVWMAASWLGLARIDETGAFEWFGGEHGLAGQVTSVRSTTDGRLWVSVSDRGLFLWKQGKFLPVYSAEDVRLRRLFRSRSGGLYFATDKHGVGRIENGEFAGLVQGVTPEENNVFAVLEDPDGTTFVGTEAGLRVLDGERLVRPPQAALQVERPVYSLARDAKGRLWCGTDNGVVRWNGVALRRYAIEQGLGGSETNRAALLLDSRNRMWIGTSHGVSIYREGWDTTDPVPPLVHIDSVLAGGNRFALGTNLDLRHHDHDLTFNFRALSFIDEGRILIRSRLEGLDDEWSAAVGPSRRELRYLHVPPGRYRLHLQAESVDGAKSEIYRSAWVTVAPPFFRRPTVLALAVVIAVLLLYFAHRYLAQRRYALELESEVARRTAHIRQVEEELTRSKRFESLASFAGGVAHDFNNLLSVILGNLSLLRRHVHDTAPLDRAEEAVGQATKLTGQFLTFARGGSPVRKVSDLEAIVREAAALVLAGAKVRPVFEIPDDLPCAEVDAGQMAQVFNNLLLNAVQAMPEGGLVRITASSLECAPAPLPPNRAVRISIEDEGPGISPEVRDRIFDPFFTTKEKGQGLGLASAYSIVNRHGGLLKTGTSNAQGARFDVILMATESRPVTEQPTPAVPFPAPGRVLVMDDDGAVRTVLRTMLEGMGYSVSCANDGESAVARYADALNCREPFDTVILDLTVRGGMGGAKAMERLVAMDPDVAGIVISGYSDDPVMAEPERYGFRCAIAKPFRPDKLARALRRVVEASHETAVDHSQPER